MEKDRLVMTGYEVAKTKTHSRIGHIKGSDYHFINEYQ